MPRGKAQRSLGLIDAAHRILAEHQPATVRAICYQLFVQGLIGSMSRNETNRVSRLLVDARARGRIPNTWIVDETRAAARISSWAAPAAFIRTVRRAYRKDHWALQPRRVEVWSEKGTVRGTLAPVLEDYGVTFRVMHGYASATAIYDVTEERKRSRQPLTALYVGDWDPSGLHMSEEDLPERLLGHWQREIGRAEADAWAAAGRELKLTAEGLRVLGQRALEASNPLPGIGIIRVALTEEDTEGDLPSFAADTKRGDSRWGWYTDLYGDRCWELDALSPVVLRARVGDAIDELLDAPLWDRSVAAEEVEAASLATVLDAWNGNGGHV